MPEKRRLYLPGRAWKVMTLAMLISFAGRTGTNGEEHQSGEDFSDPPAIDTHLAQADIDAGRLDFSTLLFRGAQLFNARFNKRDGQGRPGATGDSKPTKREHAAPEFIRTSGPDSNSCAGCHNQPAVGGAGDTVANVFVLAQFLDPVTDSVSNRLSNERNTISLLGTGAVEMLAREMTAELLQTRARAEQMARATGAPVSLPLVAKNISFGSITMNPDGTVDGRAIQGVDPDLVIKPFSFKGVVISLREFTINAMNHHHGMEAIERFGWPRTGMMDFDEDGVPEELTVGDITAATLFQAALPVPTRASFRDPKRRNATLHGERLFESIGCNSCHVPALELSSRYYTEPNPYNRPGNLAPHHVSKPFQFDLTEQGLGHRLEKAQGGKAIVRLYSDLKRHRICDADDPFFCNERLRQDGVALDEFLTPRLWDVASTAPYGHRGDLTTLTETIRHHSGEARPASIAFANLPANQKSDLIEFLLSLRAGSMMSVTCLLSEEEEQPKRCLQEDTQWSSRTSP